MNADKAVNALNSEQCEAWLLDKFSHRRLNAALPGAGCFSLDDDELLEVNRIAYKAGAVSGVAAATKLVDAACAKVRIAE